MGFNRHALVWRGQYIRLAETGHAIVKDMIVSRLSRRDLVDNEIRVHILHSRLGVALPSPVLRLKQEHQP